MSWTLSANSVEATDLEAILRSKATDAVANYGQQFGTPEERVTATAAAAEQINAAIEAALDLVRSGTVIPNGQDGTVNVNLSGHANPSHLASGGWAADQVMVSVSSNVRAKEFVEAAA